MANASRAAKVVAGMTALTLMGSLGAQASDSANSLSATIGVKSMDNASCAARAVASACAVRHG